LSIKLKKEEYIDNEELKIRVERGYNITKDPFFIVMQKCTNPPLKNRRREGPCGLPQFFIFGGRIHGMDKILREYSPFKGCIFIC
jgi:hypothetical protein